MDYQGKDNGAVPVREKISYAASVLSWTWW